MNKFFNTAGPNIMEDHHSIDPLARVQWSGLQQLVDQKRYFVLHAPRQSGKTTLLNAIVDRLNRDGKYRENSEAWRKRVVYEEAAPQLLLQAWLQRVVNGGGRIEREYALGTGRADILVRSFHREDDRRVEMRFVVEIKIKHARHDLATTIKEGLEQTAAYADRCDPEEAHLIVVDPTSSRTRSWKEKIYVKKRTVKGCSITVWGM